MQDKLYQVMVAKYEAEIADAKFKISTLVDRPMIIPEHIDITGEVDLYICYQKHPFHQNNVRTGNYPE